MIRFICFLLNKQYEPCKGCETLKSQLAIANEDRQRLTDTLVNILQPKVVESAPIEINQLQQTSALFSRRRAALEAKDREDARILKQSTNIGKPDFVTDKITTERMEAELGIEEKEGA